MVYSTLAWYNLALRGTSIICQRGVSTHSLVQCFYNHAVEGERGSRRVVQPRAHVPIREESSLTIYTRTNHSDVR
jgi:hypothetical protein